MWCRLLCFVFAVTLSASAWSMERVQKEETSEETSDGTAEYIHVDVKGVLQHGKSNTTITANGITWQLQLPRTADSAVNPKFLERAKSINGQRAIVKGTLLRKTTDGEKQGRWIVRVWELKRVPRIVSLTLVADDKGSLARIYLRGKQYKQPADVQEALSQLKRIDRIVLDCDSRLQYGHVISVLSIASKLTSDVKIRKRVAPKRRIDNDDKPER